MEKLTVSALAAKLELEVVVAGDMNREVCGGYVGDLLSWIIGKAQEGDAWITVMGNINSIAVASLADVACIILSENSPLDSAAKEKAELEEINVLSSGINSYNLAVKLSELLSSANS